MLLIVSIALLLAGLYLLQSALTPGRVAELSKPEFDAAQGAFAAALAGQPGAPDGMVASPLGHRELGVVLRETEEDRAGRGEYVVRGLETAAPLLIAAPHRRADRFTGTLARQLYAESDAAAAAWNSAPRRGPLGKSNDVARLRRHPFTAFALAFAVTYPAGRIVQLHGFDHARRRTDAARKASVIISSGSVRVSGSVEEVAGCLRTNARIGPVLVYPADVDELGATTNAQGAALQDAGFGGFVHLELSLPLRKELARDTALREWFAKCLRSGL